jgi:hypothetical protein
MNMAAMGRVIGLLMGLAEKHPEALKLVEQLVRAIVTGRDPVEAARRALAAVAARKGAHAVADAALRLQKKAKG